MHDDTYARTVDWFETAFPSIPDGQFAVQLGVHFEEVAECIGTLTADEPDAYVHLVRAYEGIQLLAEYLKNESNPKIRLAGKYRAEFLDSLCDQIVTATGTGSLGGFHMLEAMQEVNRSNFSKFVDGKPVFKNNGKIGKGPNYIEPDLTPYC